MVKHIGKYPSDARIYIDYNLKEVLIDYPIKQTKFKHIYKACCRLWFSFVGISSFFIYLFFILDSLILVILFSQHLLFGGIVIKQSIQWIEISVGAIWQIVLGLYVLLYIFIVPPFILTVLYYLFPNYFSVKVPEWNSKLNRIISMPCEMRYKNINKKEILIPFFYNNFINYSAKGDYSKYLSSITIEPIRAYKREFFNRSKRKLQTLKWFALFTFNEVPKEGHLDVKFL